MTKNCCPLSLKVLKLTQNMFPLLVLSFQDARPMSQRGHFLGASKDPETETTDVCSRNRITTTS